jgi:AmmeMemoRadiSam system protein A
MSPLPEADRRALLRLARRAIEEIILHDRILDVPKADKQLAAHAGIFVSLHRHGKLRGCIGQVDTSQPLIEGLVQCAIAAARSDPRFDPVRREELASIEIEISVLSPLAPIQPEQIVVGVHGLVVSSGRLRGLLLPQVPGKYGWTRERFLEETCVKAGLPRDSWKSQDTLIHAFTAEVFSEKEYPDAAASSSA